MSRPSRAVCSISCPVAVAQVSREARAPSATTRASSASAEADIAKSALPPRSCSACTHGLVWAVSWCNERSRSVAGAALLEGHCRTPNGGVSVRILFFGNHTVGVRALSALSETESICAVVAHPPDSEDGVRYESVYEFAGQHGWQVIRSHGKNPALQHFVRSARPDLIW